jgi:hypothetical protein
MANKFETQLENIGKIFVDVFKGVDKVAIVAEPFVDIAFPALAPVYNAAANGAAAALAAGKGATSPTNTDTQNLVAVAVAVEPLLTQYAQQAGLSAPTLGTVMLYAQALQKSLAAIK